MMSGEAGLITHITHSKHTFTYYMCKRLLCTRQGLCVRGLQNEGLEPFLPHVRLLCFNAPSRMIFFFSKLPLMTTYDHIASVESAIMMM